MKDELFLCAIIALFMRKEIQLFVIGWLIGFLQLGSLT
jgi:uncharacterized membrane protein YGL010W